MPVSEDIARQLYWMYWLWVMLLLIAVVGFVISAKSQRLATNLGKVIDRRVAKSCNKDGDIHTRNHKFEGCGFEYHCRLNIFLVKMSLKMYL